MSRAELSRAELSRRTFLQAAGAGAVSLRLGDSRLYSGPKKNKQKAKHPGLGFSLYGMRSLKVPKAIQVCSKIGYDSVELVATAGWPTDPLQLSKAGRREVRTALNDSDMGLAGVMENIHLITDAPTQKKNLDRLRASCELTREMAQHNIPVLETVLGGKSKEWEQVKGEMVKWLKEWEKIARSTKTIVAIKAHVGGALHTPDGATWLIDQIDSPWIKLNYDFSHFQLIGLDLEKSLTTMIDDAVFIHIKDTKGKAGDFRFLLPGDGNIDYRKYLDLVRRSAYRSDLVVEVSGQIHGKPGYDPIHAAKHSYSNLAPVMEESRKRQQSS